MREQTPALFSRGDVHSVQQNERQRIISDIRSLQSDYVLNVSEEDLIKALVEEHTWRVPVLLEENIAVADFQETAIDVSRDPTRIVPNNGRPYYIPGSETTIAIPFEGDAAFFEIRPSSYSVNALYAEVVSSEIHLKFRLADPNPQMIKNACAGALAQIKQNLDRLRESAKQFNDTLEPLVRSEIAKRKAKLLADSGMVASLGLPIRKTQGVPTTYTVPVQKREARIERPTPSSDRFKPEPTLASDDYESILGIMRSMVTVMERSPHAFETMGEEDLRTHFLVALNAQYEGQATGETFNFQGRTDILIRNDDKNVFIAECKFWRGPRQFLETIDQLLGYLSWRDSKTAIVLFSRNARFSDVLAQIPELVKTHGCCKRELQSTDISTFRYVFQQPNDANRELILTVMAFDVPTESHESQ
jgi:hypothetical protein